MSEININENAPSFYKIDGQLLPTDNMAYICAPNPEDIADGKTSEIHFRDGNVWKFSGFNVRDAVSACNAVYFPQDNVAIPLRAEFSNFSWDENGTQITFAFDHPKKTPVLLQLKTAGTEVVNQLRCLDRTITNRVYQESYEGPICPVGAEWVVNNSLNPG